MSRVLILCTGNSCRSQMAEGLLRSMDGRAEVYSAGTFPAAHVHPLAVRVMEEIGIDISSAIPKSVEQFTGKSFDAVITVCDDAREACPVFTGDVKRRIHRAFKDPSFAHGTPEEVLQAFRGVRDEMKGYLQGLAKELEG